MVGLTMAERAAVIQAQRISGLRSVIFVAMNGGPSQLETFDPKPEAPSHIRGPLRTFATSIPGVYFSEGFPQLAQRASGLSIIRSLQHDVAPLHATGHQLMYTGGVASLRYTPASFGALAARLLGPRAGAPAYVLVPGPVSEVDVRADTGAGAGWLGTDYEPVCYDGQTDSPPGETASAGDLRIPEFDDEPAPIREAYGSHVFGRNLWRAARLVERGVRVVVVNLCPRLQGEITWDAHGHKHVAPATLCDYRDTIGPAFDRACSALLDDLEETGLLDETFVVCTGEFGRSPRVNQSGGREHWPHCWSALVAGCGVPGGQVIGATDSRGREVIERPVTPTDLLGTALRALRIQPETIESLGQHAGFLATTLPELVA